MSLLANIQEKKRRLATCSTTVTKISGEKFVETLSSSGEVTETKLEERHAGYIVDLNPDFQLAQVLPYLTFGSQDVVANLQLLEENKVTHVLSLGVKPTQIFTGIAYKFIDLLDTPDESLLDILPETNSLIDCIGHLNGCKVFVHCNAGCSRAPSVVIGYLMFKQGYSYEEAFQLVGDKRYVRPNDGFVAQLKSWQLKVSKKQYSFC